MPIKLDSIDTAILNALSKDGRKSFRQMAREIGASAPTVKLRYERLVSVGLIKSVSPVLDLSKITRTAKDKLDNNLTKTQTNQIDLENEILLDVDCEYCKAQIAGKPLTLKILEQERFFCCTSCRSLYKEKYRGRIDALLSKESANNV
ncbi:MAG: AsnC family transcriptional regulator [Candidatus Nitrosotenuis sp.]|nr:MAG: AsnC family transcriptional regulator [Candidatus Nitrosotenuis sp.]